MLKRLIPIVNGQSPRVKSSTAKHLEAVFSAIILMVNIVGGPASERFVTALSVAMERVQGLLIADPLATISSLKSMHKAYFEWIRNGPRPSLVIADNIEPSEPLSFSPQASVLESIVTVREFLVGQPDNNILFYDRMALAFLSLHRVIILPHALDFSSITSPSTMDPKSKDLITEREIMDALHTLGITPVTFKRVFDSKSRGQQHMVMSTAGVNGKASWTAFTDAVTWLRNTELFPTFQGWLEGTGLQRFLRDLIRTARLPNVDVKDGLQTFLGRIYSFAEWGGKTRHVAIVDYWTQLAFTPLHDTIFHFLNRIPMDATHNQDAAAEQIRKWTADPDSKLYSYDLTAATDRLPLSLQTRVLAYLMQSTALASAWAKILTGREYFTEDSQFLNYTTGAPMGSKSNWAMLALTHHVIVQVAAKRAGETKLFTNYFICGDDSTLNHATIHVMYLAIMVAYGLTINFTKSIVHSESLKPAAEFCKRLFISGVEYTVLPPKLLAKTVMNGRLAPQLQSELLRRGLTLTGTQLAQWFAGFLDRESLIALGLMNKIPTSITGLLGTIAFPSALLSIKDMYKDVYPNYTENDIVQAYTYVTVIQQLQRLDALLRQTETIVDAIRNLSAGYSTVDLSRLGWTDEFMNSATGTALLALQSELDIFHPIVLASKSEATRIGNLLLNLATGSSSLSSTARLHLLDEFRNALVSVFDADAEARGQADRTLLNRATDVLDHIIHLEPSRSGERILSFNTTLTYLERQWTVSWVLGSNVTINSVRSRVTISSQVSSSSLDTAFSEFSIVGSYASKRAVNPQAASYSRKVKPDR